MYFLNLSITRGSTVAVVVVFYCLIWITDIIIRAIATYITIYRNRGVLFWILMIFRAFFFVVRVLIIYHIAKYVHFTL